MAAPRSAYRPLGRRSADRYAVLGWDLVEALAEDDQPRAAAMLAEWHGRGDVDPWNQVLAVATLAVRRPCGRAHPTEG